MRVGVWSSFFLQNMDYEILFLRASLHLSQVKEVSSSKVGVCLLKPCRNSSPRTSQNLPGLEYNSLRWARVELLERNQSTAYQVGVHSSSWVEPFLNSLSQVGKPFELVSELWFLQKVEHSSLARLATFQAGPDPLYPLGFGLS